MTRFIPRVVTGSSAIASVGYSEPTGSLEIEFVGGALYRFVGVPRQAFEKLITAESKGRCFNEIIRPQYQGVVIGRVVDKGCAR
jgi:hypothetical protein